MQIPFTSPAIIATISGTDSGDASESSTHVSNLVAVPVYWNMTHTHKCIPRPVVKWIDESPKYEEEVFPQWFYSTVWIL